MKKLYFLLAAAFLATSSVNAQIELKALIGTNFASLSNPPENLSLAAKSGFQYGAGLLIGDKFYIEPGIQFVRHSKTITALDEEFSFVQNFVKVPVYAGYHLIGHESGPVALRVFAGPAAYISGKIKEGEDQITRDDIKNAHWMFDAGIGVDVLFLFVELNYEYGLSKYWTDQSLSSRHAGYMLNAGIHLDF